MGHKPADKTTPVRSTPQTRGNPAYKRMPQPPARENPEAAYDTEDPYLSQMKYADMAQCQDCGIVHHEGRWFRQEDLPRGAMEKLGSASQVTCPACRKINDKFAMGIVEIRGEFAMKHRDEIERLIRGSERRRHERNPLERVIAVSEQDNGYDVHTTDEGLAFHIARQLERAYSGKVEYNFDGGTQKFLRAVWSRS